MTWAKIREHFMNTVGDSTASNHEAWEHITQGYRVVLQSVDVPEAYVAEATVVVPPDPDDVSTYLDYIDLDSDVFAIDSVVNLTLGQPVIPEPAGMPGRDRFLDSTTGDRAKPPVGEVRYFVRQGTRIYLRSTPDASTKLMIRYRRQAPPVDTTQVNDHPLTPQQYDWAIVYASAANYYMAHREANNEIEGQLASVYYSTQASQITEGMPHNPVAEEEKSMRHGRRVQGYRLTPRSRRR